MSGRIISKVRHRQIMAAEKRRKAEQLQLALENFERIGREIEERRNLYGKLVKVHAPEVEPPKWWQFWKRAD